MSKKKNSVDKDAVFVQQSPVSNIKQKGNLTGNTRVLRDHVGDINDLIHQWNNELIEGANVISDIKGFVFSKIDAQKKNPSDFPHTEQLQNLSKKLEQICERMELIVEKLGQKSNCIISIQRLEEKHNRSKPLFLTWPASKFVETSNDIHEMYRKEMEWKTTIKEEICLCTDKNTLVFYSTAWVHQPYIDKSVNLNFEAMLKETGYPSIYDKSTTTFQNKD